MSSVAFIYALCEPDTGEVRYVGKANNPDERYKRHYLPIELNAKTHKANWLKSLLRRGLKAELLILESVSTNDWQQAEKRWIAKFRADGIRLTNSTNGGEGIQGVKHKPEVRARISEALRKRVRLKSSYDKASAKLKGKTLPIEHRQKLSEAHKRYWESLSDEERQEYIKRIPRDWSEEKRTKLANTQRGLKKIVRTSSYVGVCWYKRDECWRANIKVGKRQVHLGYFVTEIDAAIAYNHGALHHFGNLAKFNDILDWQSIQPQRFSKVSKKPIQLRLF